MKIRNIIFELKSPLKHRVRKNLFFRYMILANIATIILISFYLLNVTAIPIIIPLKNNFGGFNDDNSKIEKLQLLVDKSRNLFDGVSYSSGSFYDKDTNILGTIGFDPLNRFQRQPYVANGYIGSRIPNLGQGFAYDEISNDGNIHDITNGWPLFNKRYSGAFAAGFYNIQEKVNQTNFAELYEDGYESIIAALPQWTALSLSVICDNKKFTLDPSLSPEEQGPITNYVQNLSLSTGIVSTEYTWLGSIKVKYEVLAHKNDISLGMMNLQIKNMGDSTIMVRVEDKLDFLTSQRSQLVETNFDTEGIYIVFQPKNINYATGSIYSRLDTDGEILRSRSNSDVLQYTNLKIKPGEIKDLYKYVGIVTSDLNENKFNENYKVLNFAKEIAEKYSDYEFALELHKDCWFEALKASITFYNNDMLTMVTRASLYHLLSNSRENAEGLTAAIPVGGLSSDSYGGMVFWDTDLWIFNSLLPISPSSALSIVNYRNYTHSQAIKNLKDRFHGAIYPWTSGRFGNCTSTGPCYDYEYHINIAISMAAWNIYLSGSASEQYTREVIYPIIHDAALFFADFVKYDKALNSYVTYNMTDPDEYANHIDNGAYTNAGIAALMKWCIALSREIGVPIDYRFEKISENMYLPISKSNQNIIMEYNDMNSSVEIKQADVVMITYPLDNELSDDDLAYRSLKFYANKQSSHGPAMTFPIFSIVSAALSTSGCSHESYLKKSIIPYLRGPFVQFSEQNHDEYNINGGTHPAFPFVTANGGFLQAILHGITGLRYGYKIIEDKIVRCLHLDPVDISGIDNEILFEGIQYMNRSLTIRIQESKLFIRIDKNLDSNFEDYINLEIASRNKMSGSYKLYENDELIVPLFVPNQSFIGSITECNLANFIPLTKGKFGDLGCSINDGDNTTHWQAFDMDITSKIFVDLKEIRKLNGGIINWGNKPPKYWKLYSLNSNQVFDSVNHLMDTSTFTQTPSNIIEKELQYESLNLIVNETVSISEPFDAKEAAKLKMPTLFNLTSFELENIVYTRYALIEFSGTHDFENDLLKDTSGAKVAEVTFY